MRNASTLSMIMRVWGEEEEEKKSATKVKKKMLWAECLKGGCTPPTQSFVNDYYYCILTGASPLLHKDKVPAEGAAH